jgi:hypothetical protein
MLFVEWGAEIRVFEGSLKTQRKSVLRFILYKAHVERTVFEPSSNSVGFWNNQKCVA